MIPSIHSVSQELPDPRQQNFPLHLSLSLYCKRLPCISSHHFHFPRAAVDGDISKKWIKGACTHGKAKRPGVIFCFLMFFAACVIKACPLYHSVFPAAASVCLIAHDGKWLRVHSALALFSEDEQHLKSVHKPVSLSQICSWWTHS